MKILTITVDPNAGGSSISLLKLIKGLKSRGHEIHVVIPKEGFLSEQLKKAGIAFTVVPTIRIEVWPLKNNIKDYLLYIPRLGIIPVFKLLSKFKLNRLIKNFSPDIIHSNVSLCSVGYDLSIENNIPHAWHIREYGDLDFDLKYFPSRKKHLGYLNRSYTIAISEGLKKYFRLTSKCKVIFNGIKEFGYTVNVTTKDNYILYVGHVNPHKGVSELIKAYIKYRKEGGKQKLLIAGTVDHKYQSELNKILIKDRQDDNVVFLGQRKDVDELMHKARVLVVPSKYEAFGRITAEAMFNKCLVVGKNTGGTKEQIELGSRWSDRDIAYLYEDEEQLKEILLSIDTLNDDKYKKMTEYANRYVREFYSTERNIEETERYFNQILTKLKYTDCR